MHHDTCWKMSRKMDPLVYVQQGILFLAVEKLILTIPLTSVTETDLNLVHFFQ